MEPTRTWTVSGEQPLTINIYRPTMTIQYGDGPEVLLNTEQVSALNGGFAQADHIFQFDDPDAWD